MSILFDPHKSVFGSILIYVHRPAGYSCICGGAFSSTCFKSSFCYHDTSHSTHRLHSVTRSSSLLRIWRGVWKDGLTFSH